MATDAPDRSSGRPRPWLLVLLALAVGAYFVTQFFPVAVPGSAVSTTARTPGPGGPSTPLDPAELDVRLEALEEVAPPGDSGDRNPFRFQPKPPPPMAVTPPPAFNPAPVNPGPVEPPGPPPIGNTIKFIGIVETGKVRIGAFSYYDEAAKQCTATFPGREGEILEGRYRVVRIGVESAVLEYTDGTGRTTIPLNGQACVVR